MGWLAQEEAEILQTIRLLKQQMADLVASQKTCCQQLNDKLDQVLVNTTAPPVAAFTVTTTILDKDGNVQQGGDLQDNGTVRYVATPVDAVGGQADLPAGSNPSWSSSDSSTIAVVADPKDVTGLTAIGTPLKLGSAVVATIAATTPKAVISGSSDPVNVIAGPPTGFAVTEQ